MRHIPEEELHAYLDQALSRSQCVEIETHLARCIACRDLRDEVARLRDRTTALLAAIGPRTVVPPPLEVLRGRYTERRARVRRLALYGAWAASLLLALGAGWQLSRSGNGKTSAMAATQATSAGSPSVVASAPVDPPAPPRDERPVASKSRPHRPTLVRANPTRYEPPQEVDPVSFFAAPSPDHSSSGTSLEVTSLASDPVPQGLWRRVAADSDASLGSDVPRVPGLPVLSVRVQPGDNGGTVTAVDQLLDNGELIRTIAGPAAQVAPLVAQSDSATGAAVAGAPPGSAQPAAGRITLTVRRGDRMLAVTGPSEILGSILSKVNPRKRY